MVRKPHQDGAGGAVGVTERSDREERQTVGVRLLPRRDGGIAACLAALGGRSH